VEVVAGMVRTVHLLATAARVQTAALVEVAAMLKLAAPQQEKEYILDQLI
jgi:hypothetical protein